MAVVEAIANNTRAIMILNTANRSALPFLDERAVVEVPCIVGRTGPVPVAIGAVPAHAQALVTAIKDVERTTIQAALTDSADLAVRALALHPLVPSVRPRATSSPATAAAPRAAGALRRMSVDVVVTATAFMDITFIGLESVPAPGRGALRRRPAALARRRRHQRDRRRAARAQRRARGAARRGPRRALHPRGARGGGHRALHQRRHAHPDHRGDAVGRRARDGHLRARREHERRRGRRLRAARRRSSRSTSSTSCPTARAATRPAATTTRARSPRTRRATSTAPAPCSSTAARRS